MSFQLGDLVRRTGSEYVFDGVVVGIVVKLSGSTRYVVENGDGILHIFGPGNLALRKDDLK